MENYEKSKAVLGNETILTLIEIILDFNNSGNECILELYCEEPININTEKIVVYV